MKNDDWKKVAHTLSRRQRRELARGRMKFCDLGALDNFSAEWDGDMRTDKMGFAHMLFERGGKWELRITNRNGKTWIAAEANSREDIADMSAALSEMLSANGDPDCDNFTIKKSAIPK